MTPPHSAVPLDLSMENLSSEAWDSVCSSTCSKALEQGEVVVGATIRGGEVSE